MNEENQISDVTPIVDITKSIQRKRLVYKSTGIDIISDIISYILLSIFIFLGIIPILKEISEPPVPIWLLIVSVLFVSWLITGISLRNSLVKIIGARSSNHEHIIAVLTTFYGNLEFQVTDKEIIRSKKPTGSPIWGRIIPVFFDNDLIYLNITTLGKGGSPTFIHGLSNYFKVKRIARYFKLQDGKIK